MPLYVADCCYPGLGDKVINAKTMEFDFVLGCVAFLPLDPHFFFFSISFCNCTGYWIFHHPSSLISFVVLLILQIFISESKSYSIL